MRKKKIARRAVLAEDKRFNLGGTHSQGCVDNKYE